MTELDKDI